MADEHDRFQGSLAKVEKSTSSRMEYSLSSDRLTRRVALQTVTIAGVGVPLLAACSADEEPAAVDDSSQEPSSDAPSQAESESAEAESGGDAVASTADIPEGGGAILGKEQIVVVQPVAGEFKAYSAVCPHQKCVFTEVADNTIKCGGCHQSEFDASDGTNTVGPNGAEPNLPALEEVAITVDGDQILLA